jgi:5'(3')-deoxyribonucleotidase
MMKKVLYIDMDGVLVDFPSSFPKLDPSTIAAYKGHLDDIPGIFSLMEPMEGAIKAFNLLCCTYDTYILSTAPWNNPTAWSDKIIWVQTFLGDNAYKRLILSHNKQLNKGDFLIDDKTKNGAGLFEGEHIHFGQKPFQGWDEVLAYLL